MSDSNPSSIPTLPGNGTAFAASASKRKTARKAQTSSARATPKRAVAPQAEEILFAAPPNPSQAPQPPYVWIDYPSEGAQLTAPTYVIRLGVGGADVVEISIDKGAWKTCRCNSGYWWYDWADIARGKHTLVARIRTYGGVWYRTPPRRLSY